MKINPKSEKGAITLVVLTGMLLLTAFLMSMYIQLSNKAQTTAETTEKIAQRYNNIEQANMIYDSYFTDTNIIPIYTREQLAQIGSGEQVLINNKVYTFSTDGYYIIQKDLDLGGWYDENTSSWTGEQWEPITSDFTGTLDGLGHTISGLYIDKPEGENQGLFGILEGTVKNLRIIDGYVNGMSYVGAIAGQNGNIEENTKGIIENCYSEIKIECSNMLIGGFCGNNNGIIKNSCSKSNLIGAATGKGGISGQNNGPGIIENCYNFGILSDNGSYIGGISGSNNGTIINSYNIGNIKSGSYIGGIVGVGRGKINSCYNKGNIEGNSYVGGICGYTMSQLELSNSYNVGKITGSKNVGKIIGYNNDKGATIKYCYYLGTTEDKAFGSNSATVLECLPKSEEELKDENIINLLNTDLETSVWVADTENKNEGYPILYWQK